MLLHACIYILSSAVLVVTQDVVVTTQYGKIRGTRKLVRNKYVDIFKGVPYASPPTGAQRFRTPIPPTPWSGVRDATNFGSICPQPGQPNFSEDCLYLNVYAPQQTSGSKELLPVMVWIHGGAYVSGAGSIYDPIALVIQGVVGVTINYRLGALGFLSAEDSVIPGNFGMLDQVLALRWVKNNIAAFGGNSSKVTIFGESAGASSVSLHLVSPLSRGLFQAAIIESGVSLSPWAEGLPGDVPTPRSRAMALGTDLGCQANDTAQLVACLRQKDVKAILDAHVKAPVEDTTIWFPLVENITGFLPAPPLTLIKHGEVTAVPTIRGTNTDEYSFWASKVPGIDQGIPLSTFLADIHTFVQARYTQNRDKIEAAIKQVYTGAPWNSTDPLIVRSAFIRLYSDYLFTAPTSLETRFFATLSQHAPVYMYMFGYRSEKDPLPKWKGVPHAGELAYVFGVPFASTEKYTNQDRLFSYDIISMWTNFAKFNNPTPQPVGGIKWSAYTSEQHVCLSINTKSIDVLNIRQTEMTLWNDIIPSLAGNHTSRTSLDMALFF